jgi:hypothetical protein
MIYIDTGREDVNAGEALMIYISIMKFCKAIDLPEPDGPSKIVLVGRRGTILYLLCLTSYAFNLVGLTVGISSDVIKI